MPNARPFYIAVFILGCIIFLHVFLSYRQNGGLVYPLDDAYIHMAISKNIAQHGVWGITRYEFSSTSSSPLYTLLLSAVFVVTGLNIWVPIVLNMLLAIGLLYLLYSIAKEFLPDTTTSIFLLALLVMLPLPALVMSGMEHTLHITSCILFLWMTYKIITNRSTNFLLYYGVAAAMVMIRYESAFMVGITSLMHLVVHRNIKHFVSLIIAIALPIVAYGLYSTSQGSFFFPNSLLVKANLSYTSLIGYVLTLLRKIEHSALFYSVVFVLIPPFLFFPFNRWSDFKARPESQISLILILATIAHLLLAQVGWFFRYEAYLIGSAFFCLMIYLPALLKWFNQKEIVTKVVLCGIILMFLFPLWFRAQSLYYTNNAMKNIHDQQLMMAGFVKQYYSGVGVAANDIGAIALFSDSPIVDMVGLGSIEVLRDKSKNKSPLFDRLAKSKNIKIAICYDSWFQNSIPSHWVKVGNWTIADNYVCGNATVSFYSVDEKGGTTLIQNLRDYATQLPTSVGQRGLYMEH